MSIEIDKSRRAVTDIAADWFVKSRDAELTRAEQKDLACWLKESPVHVREYLAIARMWGDVEAIQWTDEMQALVPREVLDDDRNVVSLSVERADSGDENAVPPELASPMFNRTTRWRALATAAALIAVVGLGVIGMWYNAAPPGYHVTALGEQRSLVLEDGSVVEMNTSSEIEVNYTTTERAVTLLAGEVLFDVRKDADRPFIVNTADVEIIVHGTKFNVYRQATETTVTVLEGNVTVVAGQADVSGATANLPIVDDTVVVRLSGGEQAIVDNEIHRIKTVSLRNSENFVAWTDRRLIFDNTPLADIFAEFARYKEVRYRISNTALAELRLTGVFKSHDLDSLILYLELIPDVSVSRHDDVIVVEPSENKVDIQ